MKLVRLAPAALFCLLLATVGAGATRKAATPAAHAPAAHAPAARAPAPPAGAGGLATTQAPPPGGFLPDTAWLVRVGPRITRVRDFVQLYYDSYPEYRPAPDSAGRVQFMQSIIHRDVMGLTALALGRPLDFEDRATLREYTQGVLSNMIFQRLVMDSVQVSDAEVQEAWRQYGYEQHFRHVLVYERALAERLRHQLLSGRISWSDAVRRYSKAPDAAQGGDIGWKKRSDIPDELALQIFSLNPGETSPVVEERDGFHLVQSVERRTVEPPVYHSLEHVLRLMLRQHKSEIRAQRITDQLAREQDLVPDTANVAFVAAAFDRNTKVTGPALSNMAQLEATVPDFAPADTGRVLARWKEGRFTVRDLMDSYSALPPVVRPNLGSPDAVVSQTEAVVLDPYRAKLAIRLGLDKDPLAVRMLARKREELLVDHLYQDSVGSRVWVSKPERLAYYEKNKPQFITYSSVRFAAITRPSKASADSLAEALRHGADPAAILSADSLAGNVTGAIQTRTEADHGPYQKLLFEEMRPGQVVVGPPDKQGVYIVFDELSFDKGHQLTYAESESMIDESLQNVKADQATQALVARLGRRYRIASRPELVMRVRLEDPTLTH